MMNQAEKIKRICRVLKARFPNLSVEEAVDLSFSILEVIEDPDA